MGRGLNLFMEHNISRTGSISNRNVRQSKNCIYENLLPIYGNHGLVSNFPESQRTDHTSQSTPHAYTDNTPYGSSQSNRKKRYRRFKENGNVGSQNNRRRGGSAHLHRKELSQLSEAALKDLIVETLLEFLKLHISSTKSSIRQIKKCKPKDHCHSSRCAPLSSVTHAEPSGTVEASPSFLPRSYTTGRVRYTLIRPRASVYIDSTPQTYSEHANRRISSATRTVAVRETLFSQRNSASDPSLSDDPDILKSSFPPSQPETDISVDPNLNHRFSKMSTSNRYSPSPHIKPTHPKIAAGFPNHTPKTSTTQVSSPNHTIPHPHVVPHKRVYSNNGTLKKTRFERQAHVLSRSSIFNPLKPSIGPSTPR